ncbi:metallo-beta-lactamase domain protein [delta proteobacterium NaphS2]|nr:metallo-beta-lactamase domain protein [delta proteobacterium NaphS2]
MLIEQMKVGPMAVFSYIVGCETEKEALVIDPADSEGRILDRINSLGLVLKYVVNTHSHADHTCGNRTMLSKTKAQLVIHEDDAGNLTSGKNKAFTLALGKKPSPEADILVKDDDLITIGRESLRVIHTPGHSPGSMCLFSEGNLFTGDTLFVGAVGRTDLGGGDLSTLLLSLKKLLALPLETTVWPGHDYGESHTSTLAHEKGTNPYITDFL